MKQADKFNQTSFSHWINGSSGRVFRICAGVVFFVTGIIFRDNALGVASIIWSFFPLSAGLFDICYISAVLGGPLFGLKIRKQQFGRRMK
jgi:hypothetical protein